MSSTSEPRPCSFGRALAGLRCAAQAAVVLLHKLPVLHIKFAGTNAADLLSAIQKTAAWSKACAQLQCMPEPYMINSGLLESICKVTVCTWQICLKTGLQRATQHDVPLTSLQRSTETLATLKRLTGGAVTAFSVHPAAALML
jgi:hypothetical protein